jgi:hypothetical protein
VQAVKHLFVPHGNRAQKAAPRKVNVNLIGNMIELGRKVLHRRMHEQNIRKPTFTRFPIDLLRQLVECFSLHVDPDVELVGMDVSAPVDIALSPVPMSTTTPPPVRGNQILELLSVELVEAFATDDPHQ